MAVAILLNAVTRTYKGIPAGFQLMGLNSTGIRAICQRPERDSHAPTLRFRTPNHEEQYLQPVFIRGKGIQYRFVSSARKRKLKSNVCMAVARVWHHRGVDNWKRSRKHRQ
ncbi:hypothetical protein H112_05323 [Trichophyton rubrum D6]|nr:hypothetical protein H112_05323 [Trichophyton rubrum D6]